MRPPYGVIGRALRLVSAARVTLRRGCANIAHMDKQVLGARMAQAREDAGLTQEGLGRAVGLDRTAITRLEKGERKLSVPELVSIAEALTRPLAFFVQEPGAAVVSRRTDTARTHDTTPALDRELEAFAADVEVLLDMALLDPSDQQLRTATPQDHPAAEAMATAVRSRAGLGTGSVTDLGAACERLGLLTFSAPLGEFGPDGGCVEVVGTTGALGAAVINGNAPAGRRRMTLAHELGHWLAGDAYDASASTDSERMLRSFAIHFLAPRAGVTALWNEDDRQSTRDRALTIGARFRLSWSATSAQLQNLGLISPQERDALERADPKIGDFVRLQLAWSEELAPPYLSPSFAAACVDGFVNARLTSARAIELLRGTLAADELPIPREPVLDDLRRSFADHGD